MKIKRKILLLSLITTLTIVGIFAEPFILKANVESQTETVKNGSISSMITASGNVEAENQANLSFLAVGRVAYLGVKAGDFVTQGEVLANLDATIAAHNLTAAEAGHRAAEAALDKVLDDIHLFQYGNGGFANVGTSNETQTQKTQRQEAEEAVNVAYDNVQSAREALALQSIIAPFDGQVLSISNLVPQTNVSPTSGSQIVVIGGGDLKFVADISEQDINKVAIGQPVTLTLDADKNKTFSGTITKIADGQTILSDGRVVFKVDIQSADIKTNVQPGQTGTVQITTKEDGGDNVPSWTVLANKYVWVIENGQAKLKEVLVGSTVNGKTVIKSGLSQNDQVILNPEIIVKNKYKII